MESTQESNLCDEYVLKILSTQLRVCKRRSFKVHNKLKVVRMFERGQSVRSLGKKFVVNRSTIQGWIRNKNKLIQTLQKDRKFYCSTNQ
jgi:transposase-like protein